MMSIKEQVTTYIHSLGITEVGFTDGNPLFDYADFFMKEHQEKAIYFDIGYEKSLDEPAWYTPSVHLEKVKSIITILLPYEMSFVRGKDKPKYALSKAAVFKDYHQTMSEYIRIICNYIEREYGKKSIGFSDTGPLNDKAVLLKTGTAKILRNSLLYNENFGSRFYIAYILTELDLGPFLEVDYHKLAHPFCNHCGRCAKACPNKAIDEHGHLNSKRCISFLTQDKHWEELDKELTLKGYVYGCDICQLVCPLNGKKMGKEYQYPSIVSESVDEEELKAMSNRQFREKYMPTAAGWVGKKRFLRNIRANKNI